MNKNRIFNSMFIFFMLVGVYHIQGCTVLVDVSTGGQTQSSTTEQTTSFDLTGSTSEAASTSTGTESSTSFDSSGSSSGFDSSGFESSGGSSGSETHAALCGDCIQHESEECEPCSYKGRFMSSCDIALTSKCQLIYNPIPQLDCTNNWKGDIGCDSEEADLYCQILTKNVSAKAKDFSVGTYIATRGLFSQQLINKDGVDLISIPEDVYPQVFYYEKNPYLVPTMTLQLEEGNCFTE